jgi:hypothetical protein
LGYFAADLFMVVAMEALHNGPILAHHLMALVSLYIAIDARAAHAFVLYCLATEVTTPLVNLRWRLHELGRAGSLLYAANGLAMTAAWGLARVAGFVPLCWHLAANAREVAAYLPPYARPIVFGVPVALFVLNLLWFTRMAAGAAKIVRRLSKGGSGGGKAGAAAAERAVVVEAYAAAEAAAAAGGSRRKRE